MIVSRTSDRPEHSELPLVSEQKFGVTEAKYSDKIIFGWIAGTGPTETASDRMEREQRATTRRAGVKFA